MQGEQKKLAILGVLVVVVLCVGAFQFVGGSKPAPAKKAVAAEGAAANEEASSKTSGATAEPEIRNPMFASALPSRDPFKPVPLPKPEGTGPVATTNPKPTQEPRVTPPPPMGGTIAPMPAPNPNAMVNPGSNPGGLTAVPVPETPFPYTLAGVIIGTKNGAVFQGPEGQKLVVESAWLDGETQVISIDKESVKVKFKSKTLTLKTGGNPK